MSKYFQIKLKKYFQIKLEDFFQILWPSQNIRTLYFITLIHELRTLREEKAFTAAENSQVFR